MLPSHLSVLIVGDVHGHLEQLFAALQPYPPDRWRTIFLGDLVNRGPFGVGALRFARDRPHSQVLLGNHEILTLAALGDHRERGPAFVSWLEVGGQPHDLQELGRDEGLQAWMRRLPALLRLEDGTLIQHCDSDSLGQLVDHNESDLVTAVNTEVERILLEKDQAEIANLWALMTPKHVFRRQPRRLEAWLRRAGAIRVVHGHTPHAQRKPLIYAGGRALNFDGGLGHGASRKWLRSETASVGPLPLLPPAVD